MMKVSFIIPVYNEGRHLTRFLETIDPLYLGDDVSKEFILVDDASTDNSGKILDDYQFQTPHTIIHKNHNEGKGAAIRSGIEKTSGDIILIQDADFEYSTADIPLLVAPLRENRADVVYGSRFKKSGEQVHRTYHYLVNRFLTLLSNFFSGLYLTDMETCYKAFRSDIIKNMILETNRFGFEPEVTAKLAKLRVRIWEIPISYFPRTYLEGKKISWKDGVAAIRHMIYFNFNRNYRNSFRPTLPQKYSPTDDMWL